MAKKNDIFGIKDFKMGDPGDGIAGTTLVSFPDIKEASATLQIPIGDSVRFFSETNRGAAYRVINTGSTEGIMIKLQFLGLSLEDYPKFFGGTYLAGVYTPPTASPDIYQTIELSTKVTNAAGNFMKMVIPYAHIKGGINSALTFNDLTPIDVEVEALIPVSALGVEGAAFTLEEV